MTVSQDQVRARNVPFLVHFTRTTNIPSIMEKGILPRDAFEANQVTAEINDELRLDGHLDGTSVSIGFPNSKMLWKLRQENPGVNWAVLVIAPSVLWTHDCAYCHHNAADGRISDLALKDLKSFDAFERLYEVHEGFDRQADKLKKFDPTDVQAEVLVFDPISPELIFGAAFERSAIKSQYDRHFEGRKSVFHGSRGFFSDRSYHRRTTA